MKSVVLNFLLLGEWITDLLWICRHRADRKMNSASICCRSSYERSLSLISISFVGFVSSFKADLSNEYDVDDDEGKMENNK